MTDYIRENWDGWPLHCLIAGLLMWPAVSNSYPVLMLIMNIAFWPSREAWQHNGFKNIWTPHRMVEWGAPIIVALAAFAWWGR